MYTYKIGQDAASVEGPFVGLLGTENFSQFKGSPWKKEVVEKGGNERDGMCNYQYSQQEALGGGHSSHNHRRTQQTG